MNSCLTDPKIQPQKYIPLKKFLEEKKKNDKMQTSNFLLVNTTIVWVKRHTRQC